jgi:3D-(3,5/4)-trihydroxycyclohexane-1,2-dione acylhydrolase (decyclizing)
MAKQRTVRLTVAQALTHFLSVQYSQRDGTEQRLIPAAYGIFGHGNVAGLGQALDETNDVLPFYKGCNEQSMVHIATGLAKATARRQTLAVAASIGPGSTNMLTGAALATVNRLPVLLLPADTYCTRHQGPVLQQLEHPIHMDVSVNDAFRPLSRFFDRITRPEHLLTALPEAMRVLTDPAETGAVTISLPQDIQAHAYDYPAHFFDRRVWRIERRGPDPQRIDEAVQLLKRAKAPLIIAGGGVHYSEAANELLKFAEMCGIPVGETFAGKGAIRKRSPIQLGACGVCGSGAAIDFMKNADLVLCIGTRLTDFTTGSQSAFQNPKVKFIGINVCGHDAFKQGAVPILADARSALAALRRAAKSAGLKQRTQLARRAETAYDAYRKHVKKTEFHTAKGKPLGQAHLVGIVNDVSRAGDTVIGASGTLPDTANKMWDTNNGTRALLEFGFSCMGYEIPAGIGTRMVQPTGEIYVLVGEGTYLMNPTEIVTAVQNGLKITVVVSDNHGYQCIHHLQKFKTNRSFGNELRVRDKKTNRLSSDFVQLDLPRTAEGFGARAWYCRSEAEVRTALAEARREKNSCVIVVENDVYRGSQPCGTWWDVAPAEVSKSAYIRKNRAAYERDRDKLQKYYY